MKQQHLHESKLNAFLSCRYAGEWDIHLMFSSLFRLFLVLILEFEATDQSHRKRGMNN